MERAGPDAQRRWKLVALGGAGVAAASVPLAAAAGPPYLSLGQVSAWIVTYAVGLFALLFATPFLIRARIGGRLEGDARWERALLGWGALAAVLLAVGALCAIAGGFDSDSLIAGLGLVAAVEAGLVLGILLAWLFSG